LISRTYPLFHKLLGHVIDKRNPLYGSLTFALQSVGNMLLMAALAVLMAATMRTALGRWLSRSDHAALAAGFALMLLGIVLIVYRDIRLPALFGYGWFPTMPWNS